MNRQCHGCGSVITKSLVYYPKNGNLQKGFCSFCSSWNYFEVDGSYKDPPHTDVVVKQINNEEMKKSVENYSFCDECIRNQTIVMQIMANYLPEEDDPEYQRLLLNSIDYKKDLESRYPLVCSRCAPNVNRKLLKVNKRLWSLISANADPKTIASVRKIPFKYLLVAIVVFFGVALFFDWVKLSKRVNDTIIVIFYAHV